MYPDIFFFLGDLYMKILSCIHHKDEAYTSMSHEISIEIVFFRKCIVVSFTNIRLFTSMSQDMFIEVTLLEKSFVTYLTNMRLFTGKCQ